MLTRQTLGVQLQARELQDCQPPAEAGETGDPLFLSTREGAQPAHTSRLLTSEKLSLCSSLCSGRPVCGIWSGQPQDTHQSAFRHEELMRGLRWPRPPPGKRRSCERPSRQGKVARGGVSIPRGAQGRFQSGGGGAWHILSHLLFVVMKRNTRGQQLVN